VNDGAVASLFDSKLNFQNILCENVSGEVVVALGSTINAVNLTVDNANMVFSGSSSTLKLTNSLLVSITNAGTSYTGSFNFTNNSGSVFQTVGAGDFYLADGSPYRDAGTTNTDPALLADLQNLTTYPPLILSSTFAANTTLNPQSQRDIQATDLGYHYAPIDYLGSCTVTNATLMLTNGVALGQESYGMITLLNGSQLVSQGGPIQRNFIAYYNLVQEQSTNLSGHTPDYAGEYPIYPLYTNHTVPPNIYLRFTTFCPPNVGGYAFLFYADTNYWLINNFTMQDCEVYGANGYWQIFPSSNSVTVFKNNLFQYAQVWVGGGGTVTAYNNLFTGDDTYVEFDTATFQNNAFDLCDGGTYVDGTYGCNAYLNFNTNNAYSPILTNDVIATNFTWVMGPLGNYYQATNSPLINKGSTTADQLGLYHYTVTTNEVKEANSVVDIGYHYVALGTNGLQLDTDGDGIPDYLEDANGNGLVDSGETSWTNSADMGLQVFITQPPNNSTLP
jgi:hypothetical protein